MPQRNQEPTSLRRSPRLLLLKNSPKSSIPMSKSTPKSLKISVRKPQIGSTCSAKSLIGLKECDNGPANSTNSTNGSRDGVKSANGSRRKSNLGSGIVGIRRSSRLYGELTSLIDANLSCNGVIDGVLCSNTRSRRKSKKVSLGEIDSLATNDVIDIPETPICVRERKCTDFNDSDTSGSIVVLSLGESERRVTRSCSIKLSENVETRKVENKKLNGSRLFDDRAGGGGLRKCGRLASGVIGNSNGKDNGDVVRRSIVCGLKKVKRGSLSPCATPEVGKGRENSRKDVNGRITRSASKGELKGSNLCGKERERHITSNDKDDSDIVRRSIVCGLNKVGRDSLSPCATPGVRKGKGDSRKDVNGKITSRVSKRKSKGSDLCGKEREKQTTSMSAQSASLKGQSIIANKKQESSGTVKFSKIERSKRVKLPSDKSFSARREGGEGTLRNVVVKGKEPHECGKQDGDILKNGNSGINQGTKLIGVKRKRNQAGLVGKDQGWTNEQEAALQRAYFSAKPSPLFWKKVSKLVPGKSAQECFDKVHSVNLTPLTTRHASKFKKHNSPSEFSLTSDELLKSIPTKSKKLCKSKPKSHVARRNVRHLLQKYCQDSPADLFSILEPSGNPLAETLKFKSVQLTPLLSPGSNDKRLSRLSGLRGSPLTSPPVLKKVKNMDMHEKYIDKLHVREGKRKSVSSQFSKSVQCQKDGTQNSAQRKNAIKAAKDALVSDARDVIEKFRDSQTNLMEAYSDSEEVLISDNDEDDIDI